jgi:fibronectin type 3 domain-containing protein
MKKLFVVLAATILLAVMACSGGGGSPTPNSTTQKIGTAGGSVTSDDKNITVQVPEGALSSKTAITITPTPSNSNVPPGSIGAVFDLSPDGTTFNKPITISIKYDPNLLPESITEDSLTLAYISTFVSGSTWTEIPTTIDKVNKLLIGQTMHFSIYGVKIGDRYYLPYGTLIGTTPNGVDVYSNGCVDSSDGNNPKCLEVNGQIYPNTSNNDNVGQYVTGLKWYCTEFVNRYYYQIYNKKINKNINAQDYWDAQNVSAMGLVRYPNNGSGLPLVGDIIVSIGNGSADNIGHVAIVKSVDTNYIHAVEQNFYEGLGDLDHKLPINSGNIVGDFSPSYPVTGWLRLTTGSSVSPPSTPLGFSVTAASSSQINLSWTASTGTVAGYKIYRSGTYLKSVTTTSTSDAGLSASTNYCYYVTAYNEAGESVQTSQLCATTQAPPVSSPSTPTGFSVTAASSSQINLSWTASTGTVAGYKIYRSGTYLKSVTTTSTSDAGLSASTNYCYYVTAYNEAGESVQTSQLCATTQAPLSSIPAVPTNLSPGSTSSPGPTLGSNSVTVSWNASSGATSYIGGITDIAAGSDVVTIDTSGTSTPATLSSGKQYRWYVSACNGSGCSNPCAFYYFQTPSPTCTLPGAFSISGGPEWYDYTINLQTDSNRAGALLNIGTSANATGYMLTRTGGGGTISTSVQSGVYEDKYPLEGENSFTNQNMGPGESYSYYVTASNNCGFTSSNTISFTETPTATIYTSGNITPTGIKSTCAGDVRSTYDYTSNPPVTTVSQGQSVSVIGGPKWGPTSASTHDWWWQIKINNTAGWIWEGCLW